LALQSAGMGMTLRTNSLSEGKVRWAWRLDSVDMGTISEITTHDCLRCAEPAN